jgi:group I intron endonuclease
MSTYIYSLTNPNSNKIYIGKTYNLKERLQQHIKHAKYKKTKLDCWIFSLKNKNLKPVINIIEEVSEINWPEKEKYWIKYYRNLLSIRNVLNIDDGGLGASKGRPSGMKGKHLSKEAKLKISKANKGRKPSEQTRLKMSLSRKGRLSWNRGIKYSKKLRNIFSGAQIKRALNNKPTQQQIDKIIQLYGKIPRGEIFKLVGISRRNAAEVLKNKPIIMSEKSRLKMSIAKKGKMPKNLDDLHNLLRIKKWTNSKSDFYWKNKII